VAAHLPQIEALLSWRAFVWIKRSGVSSRAAEGDSWTALETAAVVEGDASANGAEAIKEPSHALGPSGRPRPGIVARRDPSVQLKVRNLRSTIAGAPSKKGDP
jgi:hypothetical protein